MEDKQPNERADYFGEESAPTEVPAPQEEAPAPAAAAGGEMQPPEAFELEDDD